MILFPGLYLCRLFLYDNPITDTQMMVYISFVFVDNPRNRQKI